jgi:hypothetical protein
MEHIQFQLKDKIRITTKEGQWDHGLIGVIISYDPTDSELPYLISFNSPGYSKEWYSDKNLVLINK